MLVRFVGFVALTLFCLVTYAKNLSDNFYVGVSIGGGSTEWKYLVDHVDEAPTPTTPTHVTEGGPSWGAVIGYDLLKNVALEFQYISFADAKVTLPQFSSYAVKYMVSKTTGYSLAAKFYAKLGQSKFGAFASIGAGLVHRQDPLAHKHSCITPFMSGGMDYRFSHHFMIESGFQYFTGFGASEIHPVYDFIPFAWDSYVRMDYFL